MLPTILEEKIPNPYQNTGESFKSRISNHVGAFYSSMLLGQIFGNQVESFI